MKLGAINDPRKDILEEINWIGSNGFDFIDLSLEPPKAYLDNINPDSIKKALTAHNLEVVGHTFCLIPIGSPFKSIRESASKEIIKCLPIFAEIGASLVNVHLDGGFPLCKEKDIIAYNIESLSKIAEAAQKYGVKIMVEHFRGPFAKAKAIEKILNALPEIGFHLDVGHANLFGSGNKTELFLKKFHERLVHVHFSDNRGGNEDMHLPIGAGNINWVEVIKTLKKYNYNGTITLEIFSEYREHLLTSKEIIKRLYRD